MEAAAVADSTTPRCIRVSAVLTGLAALSGVAFVFVSNTSLRGFDWLFFFAMLAAAAAAIAFAMVAVVSRSARYSALPAIVLIGVNVVIILVAMIVFFSFAGSP
jgi:hypothetical protein